MIRYFRCDKCGNLVESVHSSGVPMVCCGEKMRELVPGSVDAAVEKHVPVISVEGNQVTVKVSSVEHPMADVHYIEWIALEAEGRLEVHYLEPGMKPATFFAGGSKTGTVYAYCNLHGLWSATF